MEGNNDQKKDELVILLQRENEIMLHLLIKQFIDEISSQEMHTSLIHLLRIK
jgi:hypothetical protein